MKQVNARFCLLFLTILFQLSLSGQRITNAGTDFWFAFPEVFDNTSAIYWVNITSNDSANGTVSIPGASWSSSYSIKPGEVAEVLIPSNFATIRGSDTIVDRAINVTSNNDVVVFAVTYHRFRHEASLVLPNIGAGKRYRAISYQSEIKGNTLYESEFNVVSMGDTVEVRITPSADIAGGRIAGVPYNITLLPNQVYQVQADSAHDDLTGTLIESVNDSSFAVYSGNRWSTVVCRPNSDPLLEAMFPTSTWGMDYFAIPTPSVNLDYVKMVADEDTTLIFRDGILVDTLDAGEFYDDTISTVHHYTSNKPTALAHFLVTGQNSCTQNSRTDPSMIMLNATEQMFLDSITFFAVDTSDIDSHFVHVITRTTDTALMFLDSIQMVGWTVFAQDNQYSYRTERIAPGYHRLETKGCGFIAYSMGIGSAVSYGYAAGASLVDLSNAIQFSNAINGSDTICLGDSVQFQSVSLSNPLSFKWDFGDGTTDTTENPKHAYSLNGTYVVSLTTEYSCATVTTKDTVEVPPRPIADLGPDTTLCQGDTLRVSVNTHVFRALWNDGSTAPEKEIFASGQYWVQVSNFCGADTDSVVVVVITNDSINAGMDSIICQFDPYQLGGNPTGPVGAIYSWSPNQDLSNDSVANPVVIPSTAGNREYVVSVSLSQGCTLRDTVSLEVLSSPIIDAGPDKVICDDTTTSVQLGGNPTGPATSTYVWGPANRLNNSNTANPTTKDILPRVYTLLSEDTSGCTSVDSVRVGYFGFNSSGSPVDCGGDSSQLTSGEVFGTPPFTYSWSPSNTLSADSIANPLAFPNQSTTYKLIVEDSNGCRDSQEVFILVTGSANSGFNYSSTLTCNSVGITAVAGANYIGYEWKLDGSIISTDKSVQFETQDGLTQILQLVVISSDSCIDSSSQTISVDENSLTFNQDSIPNVFTPNDDGINDVIDFTRGNRFKDCSTVYVYNRWGQMMFNSVEGHPVWDGRTFTGNECKSGVYFYTLDVSGTIYKGTVTLIR